MNDVDSDSSSVSSGSDDEFLTMRNDGDNVDREALIRKKLLESFYGKASAENSEDDALSSDEDDDNSQQSPINPSSTQDLDSPHFHPGQHTAKHVLNQNTHSLLEVEEGLACQVRTLDSTMQTLVYENYSRFIEATDAVKSIGVNVQAHATGLKDLQESMTSVATTSRSVETCVGTLRDQVVEKIRVKRLLQRLDALLKLPTTLKQNIALQKYRWATKSYLQAHIILNKHSTGFDSLKRIETECHGIMQELIQETKTSLVHWSGNYGEEDSDVILDPPSTIVDIFECAGTPILILDSSSAEAFNITLSKNQCQEYSLTACLRLLERVLDTHQIELQERMFDLAGSDHQEAKESENPTWIIPTHVLDSILEAATLYSMTFLTSSPGGGVDESLSVFVSNAFSTFLTHVRGALLEQAYQMSPSTLGDEDDEYEPQKATAETNDEEAYEQIASAMALLLQSVRQLASGLELSEVAVDNELASSLVDQTVSLTEAMVRRRVDQKFLTLRQSVIQDCFQPFSKTALQVPIEGNKNSSSEFQSLLETVQLASVALSDSLQLVDDTVRSILAATDEVALTEDGLEGSYHSTGSSKNDSGMLLEAVEQSTKRFALWLAASMEILSGCEASHPKLMVQVSASAETKKKDTDTASYDTATDDESNDDGLEMTSSIIDNSSSQDLTADPVVEKALLDLMDELSISQIDKSNMILAVAEMCRVAERSVMENILQSIASHTGQKTKQHKTFQVDFPQNSKSDSNNPISTRFKLAASRILSLYAINKGKKCSDLLCEKSMQTIMSQESFEISEGPQLAVCSVLEEIKKSCNDCADLFGGNKCAGPVPETLEDEFISLTSTMQHSKSGLAFDVERMFSEKIVVYPHPNDFANFQRNTVVVLIYKVALKALVESCRLLSFSSSGYRQIMIDAEFLKFLLPHYVMDEFMADGTNGKSSVESILGEVISIARSRCFALTDLGEEQEEINVARSAIRTFLSANADTVEGFTITEDNTHEK